MPEYLPWILLAVFATIGVFVLGMHFGGAVERDFKKMLDETDGTATYHVTDAPKRHPDSLSCYPSLPDNQFDFSEWCDRHGLKLRIRNDGQHWLIEDGNLDVIEWWPATHRLVRNKQWHKPKTIRAVVDLAHYLTQIWKLETKTNA